jgi:hypothetical protein
MKNDVTFEEHDGAVSLQCQIEQTETKNQIEKIKTYQVISRKIKTKQIQK